MARYSKTEIAIIAGAGVLATAAGLAAVELHKRTCGGDDGDIDDEIAMAANALDAGTSPENHFVPQPLRVDADSDITT